MELKTLLAGAETIIGKGELSEKISSGEKLKVKFDPNMTKYVRKNLDTSREESQTKNTKMGQKHCLHFSYVFSPKIPLSVFPKSMFLYFGLQT